MDSIRTAAKGRLALLAIAASAVSTQAFAFDVSFNQLSWLSDGGGYSSQFSDWGRVNVKFDSADSGMFFSNSSGGYYGYLNIVTQDVTGGLNNWAVQNRYVQFDSLADFSGSLGESLMFDLGHGPDLQVPVTSMNYLLNLSMTPEQSMPGGFQGNSAVSTLDTLFGGAGDDSANPTFSGGTGQNKPPKAKNFEGSDKNTKREDRVKIKIDESKTEPMSEHKNHCGPGSVAKSLKYLADTNSNIKLPGTVTDAYNDLKAGMGTTEADGTYLDKWLKGKKDWVDKNKLPITTIYTSNIDDVAKALKEGCDVELFVYQGQDATKDYGGHFTFVSEIVRHYDENGKLTGYDVKTLNDLTQGDGQAGNDVITYKFDATGKCTSHFPGAKLNGFMVECPVPEPGTYMALALGVVGLVARRRRR